jgi:hypothetical protein
MTSPLDLLEQHGNCNQLIREHGSASAAVADASQLPANRVQYSSNPISLVAWPVFLHRTAFPQPRACRMHANEAGVLSVHGLSLQHHPAGHLLQTPQPLLPHPQAGSLCTGKCRACSQEQGTRRGFCPRGLSRASRTLFADAVIPSDADC